MKHATLLLLSFVCLSGCGPSAEEEYATALEIYQMEEARLVDVEAAHDAAVEGAIRDGADLATLPTRGYASAQRRRVASAVQRLNRAEKRMNE